MNERFRLPSDPIAEGLARGWRVYGGAGHVVAPARLECEVVIVGSGAGGGITAELLCAAGLDLVIVEEGPLKSSRDFKQLESEAYPSLYQEAAARKTADKSINILQGRCVGGSTTVNWTSSFRTPSSTLEFWRRAYGLDELTDEILSPWFLRAEQRLGIEPWLTPPNENNEILRRGALKLGIAAAGIPRNVRGCWNLGSCGLGCPTNAKQSMLVTTIPAALDRGARLLTQSRATRLGLQGNRVVWLECEGVSANGRPSGAVTRIFPRHVVVAGGAINSPALLLRSGVPDPQGHLGSRTFLHPVVLSAATFDQEVAGWQGAPQTVYSDHYLDVDPIDGAIGFKLEAAPLHPLIFTTTMGGFGLPAAARFAQFPNTHVLLALLRDGFHPESPGGRVSLKRDGSPELEYPLTSFVLDGARRALAAMAELQFAAGARQVLTGHELAPPFVNWSEARAGIAALPMGPLLTKMVSAHVMGGCGMAVDAGRGVVQPDGIHWQIRNLSVHDGSIFPTSIGANPQLSIYGIVSKLAAQLAKRLTGRDVVLGTPP
jgi:choline dehydrogenase-like flavoprotein